MVMRKKKKKPAAKKKVTLKQVARSRPPARAEAPIKAALRKHLPSPTSTGGGGHDFETKVQTALAILLLAGGAAPCLPTWTIEKLKLQGRYAGYETDDVILFTKDPESDRRAKLLAQIKMTIEITRASQDFAEVIKAALTDFNNPEIFDQKTDQFALITAVISPADVKDTRTILEWARDSENKQDLLQRVASQASSKGKREKLAVFRHHLDKANGTPVTDELLWQFMKRFHILGYDLEIKSGGTLSLVHTVIAQYQTDNVNDVWLRVLNEVTSANRNAGTITLETIREEVRRSFTRQKERLMPAALKPVGAPSATGATSSGMALNETVIAQLLGSWNEARPDDIAIVEELAGTNYEAFIGPLRDSLLTPDPVMKLRDGIWEVTDRVAVWDAYGPRVFDQILDRLQNVATKVLLTRDPQFELEPDKRGGALLYGKEMKYSGTLRRGLAVTLALLLNRNSVITSATHNHAELVARVTVRTVLQAADWVQWASLKSLLSTLAEAAPEQFLDAVDEALNTDPCPFDELYAQEAGGFLSSNSYISGVLWALETLAWEERYISRVAVLLAELAERDPGGRFSNRPDNSLAAMFLPWHPQTAAPFSEQLTAVKAIVNEDVETGWKLLIQLLPNVQTSTSGTSKPSWRPLGANVTEGMTNEEYFKRVTELARIALGLAKQNSQKLAELIKHLDSLPRPVFEELLVYLGSEPVRTLPEAERQFIVDQLLNLAAHHSRFPDAAWAMPADVVQRVRDLADSLKATDKALLYRRLFSNQDFDMIDFEGDYNAQLKAFEDQRTGAIAEILTESGLAGVLDFARSVTSPWQAGIALGKAGGSETDAQILPSMLSIEPDTQLVSGYVLGRLSTVSWDWVDGLAAKDMKGWTPEQLGKFFSILPFTPETWDRVERVLGTKEEEYWRVVFVNPYQTQAGLERAIEKLAKYGRPRAAIGCVYKLKLDKKTINANELADLLLAGAQSSERAGANESYQIVQLIKALQDDPTVDQGKLFSVEWLYLNYLNKINQAAPKTLERALADDPAAFVQVLGYVWMPEGAPKKEPTEQERRRATQAYRLLSNWSIIPGTRPDGTLDPDALKAWLQGARQQAAKAGILNVALSKIGQVLSHAPADPNGLWIHEAVAKALDSKDAVKIRDGYRVGVINSRGAHWVDPEGKPELALAEAFEKRAKDVEAIGCTRLGATLKTIADGYRRESAEIIRKHATEHLDD